jgi:threonine aldolase
MNFASDNWAGAHPKIAASLVANAAGFAVAYGASDLDRRVGEKFNEIFEREVAVFFVATGTAANSLALASVNRAGGVTFCHREAHMIEDECGAPEYLTGGSRLHAVDGTLGKIDPQKLKSAMAKFDPGFVHAGRPMAVSITQASEVGTVYSLDEISAVAEICRDNGIPLHMDGARFANALASLDASPAEMTWKRGVDIVSFGGTKNGCWCAEALVFLDPAMAREAPFVRKRAAQLFSKSRFVAAQFDSYFEGGLWLETARHANAMTARLAGHVRGSKRLRLAWEPQANELFAIIDRGLMERLQAAGIVFYEWHAPHGFYGEISASEVMCRFVTSFATTEAEVDRFGELIG